MRIEALLLDVAIAAVRGWTCLYTSGMPAISAGERRAEIASDLWELQHAPQSAQSLRVPLHIVLRLFGGLADDLRWRLEYRSPAETALAVRTVAAAATAAILLSLMWVWPKTPDWRALGGRPQVAACADTAPAPRSSTDLRLTIVQCAGAFFAPPPR